PGPAASLCTHQTTLRPEAGRLGGDRNPPASANQRRRLSWGAEPGRGRARGARGPFPPRRARPGMLTPSYSHSSPGGRGEQQGIRAKEAGNCPYPGNPLRQTHREHGGPELSPTGGGGGDELPPAPGTRTALPPPPPLGRSPAPHAARRAPQHAWARGGDASALSPQGG
ncbi:hypothetical protein KIL84_017805, partial [Mauremys mutica]